MIVNNNDEDFKSISELLNDDIKSFELVSETSNKVYRVNTETYGVVYAKVYLNKSSHIDHEIDLYNIIEHKYLKDIIKISSDKKIAIYKELKGKTLDELSNEELSIYKDNIVDSLIYFYETLEKEKIKGFGLLDENMNGTSDNFEAFIVNRQKDTEEILKEYYLLNSAFSKIYYKYKYLLIGDNTLVPIDTNAKNVMVTEEGYIKFIDPGELISGPKLMGYGDFVAHTYKTELYDCLMNKLKLNEEDEKRLRIYAIFSSLNILAFLKNLGITDLENVIPYGNNFSFYDLIKEHLNALDIIYE